MKISLILFVIFATTYADKVYHNITCNTIGMDFNTFVKHVRCPANCKLQYYKVWGNIRYNGYSQVCAAAIHDGQITNTGGKITVYLYKGKRRYHGSLQHGIMSDSEYNFYGIAFNFRKMSACHHSDMVITDKVYSIDCPQNCLTEGHVYGTGVYRRDHSTICASAIHDGVITRENGGKVTVYKVYVDHTGFNTTLQHGIRSYWGGWSGQGFQFKAPNKGN